jgi:hypothetical protein
MRPRCPRGRSGDSSRIPGAHWRRRVLLAAGGLLGAAVLLPGCRAQRHLVLTSEPAGASVRVDGERVGQTPLRLPFQHYGVRRVSFYLEGHEARSVLVEVDPPWYGVFPLDIFSEIVLPVGWRDQHRVHAVLEEGVGVPEGPTLRSVQERAEALRRAGPEGPRRLPPPTLAESTGPPPLEEEPPEAGSPPEQEPGTLPPVPRS